jgi:hypothetical protein
VSTKPRAIQSKTAVFKVIRLITGFDNVAMMGQPVQQCGGHLRVTEHRAPFRERQVGCNDHAGAFIPQQNLIGLRPPLNRLLKFAFRLVA